MSDIQESREFKPTHFHADGDRYELINNSAIAVPGGDATHLAISVEDTLVVYAGDDQRFFVTTQDRWAERFKAIPPRQVNNVQIDMPTVVKMRDVMMTAGGALQTFPDKFLLDTAQAMEDVLASKQGMMLSTIQRLQWSRFCKLCRAADAMRIAAKECDSAFLLHDPQQVNG